MAHNLDQLLPQNPWDSTIFIDILGLLQEECRKDPNGEGFWHNRGLLMRHFNAGEFYVLRDYENYFNWPTIGRSSTAPAFVVVSHGQILYIWVLETLRNRNYGRWMVKASGANVVKDPVIEAHHFWRKMGFRFRRGGPAHCMYATWQAREPNTEVIYE